MTPEEMRFKCLELAADSVPDFSTTADVLRSAERFYAFVVGGDTQAESAPVILFARASEKDTGAGNA